MSGRKIARTIADRSATLTAGLAVVESVSAAHLAEALQYRPRAQG